MGNERLFMFMYSRHSSTDGKIKEKGLACFRCLYNAPHDSSISVYNTCTLLLDNEKYVDAKLDAPDNAISGKKPSSQMLNTSQSRKLECAKTGNAKE